MPTIYIYKSRKAGKKYMALIIAKPASKDSKQSGGKYKKYTVHFGATGYEDYTQHKNEERKKRFKARFNRLIQKTKRDITSPMFWSDQLLWNKKSLAASIRDVRHKYGFKIINKV